MRDVMVNIDSLQVHKQLAAGRSLFVHMTAYDFQSLQLTVKSRKLLELPRQLHRYSEIPKSMQTSR